MRKSLFLIVSAVVFFAACTKGIDEGVAPESPPEPTVEADPFTIPVEEALDNMYDLMDEIYGPGTRASARASINVETITSGDLGVQTRSGAGSSMNMVYVVNFGNNQGYSVLGANPMMPPVLAVTESGNLSTAAVIGGGLTNGGVGVGAGPEITGNDDRYEAEYNFTTPEDMLRITVEEAAAVMAGYLAWCEAKGLDPDDAMNLLDYLNRDVIENPWLELPEKPRNPDGSSIPHVIYERNYIGQELLDMKGPFVQTTWNQDAPYNNECYTKSGERALAGCSAIAAAQIIAFNQHPSPSTVAKTYIASSWDELINFDYSTTAPPQPNSDRIRSDIAKIIARIGHGMMMDYGTGSSGAGIWDVAPYFDVILGYDFDGGVVKYTESRVRTMIDRGLPVFICGFGEDGHSWVIDGYATLYQTYRVRKAGWRPGDGNGDGIMGWVRDVWEENEYKDPVFLFHCNMGWGSTADGWYHPSYFDPSVGPVLRDPGTSGTNGELYWDKLKMFKYTLKNR